MLGKSPSRWPLPDTAELPQSRPTCRSLSSSSQSGIEGHRPAPQQHTQAHLPPPTIAHRQHLHILELKGGVGWVQRGTVVSHVHVDEGFGKAHPPLPHRDHSPCPGCPPRRLWAEPRPPPSALPLPLPRGPLCLPAFQTVLWEDLPESRPSPCRGVEALPGRGGG